MKLSEEEIDQAAIRLAQHIANQESLSCKSLEAALLHTEKWRRILPEAREMVLVVVKGIQV